MRSIYTHAAAAAVAGTGAALAALFLAGGPLSAQAAQTSACHTSGVTAAPSTPAATHASAGASGSTAATGSGSVTGTTGSRSVTSGSGTQGFHGSVGPLVWISAPVATGTSGTPGTSTGSTAASTTTTSTTSTGTTVPATVTAGQGTTGSQGAGSAGARPFARPLVTVRAPVNSTLGDGSSKGDLHAPAAVIVGRSSSPQATGTLANVDAPVTATGETSSSGPTLPQAGIPAPSAAGTGGQGSSSLVNVASPVQASTGSTPTAVAAGSPVPAGMG